MQKIYYSLHVLHIAYDNLLISKFHILYSVYCDQVITVIFFHKSKSLRLFFFFHISSSSSFHFNGTLASFPFIKWYVLFHTFANFLHSAHKIQNHVDVRSTVPSWNPLQTFSTKITVWIWIEGRSIFVIITIVVVADETFLFSLFLYQIWVSFFSIFFNLALCAIRVYGSWISIEEKGLKANTHKSAMLISKVKETSWNYFNKKT